MKCIYLVLVVFKIGFFAVVYAFSHIFATICVNYVIHTSETCNIYISVTNVYFFVIDLPPSRNKQYIHYSIINTVPTHP